MYASIDDCNSVTKEGSGVEVKVCQSYYEYFDIILPTQPTIW